MHIPKDRKSLITLLATLIHNPAPLLRICWPPALFLILPFLYAYFFCSPFGDDFDEATKAVFLGDFPGALYDAGRNWLTWSGRYAYHFCAVLLGAAIREPVLFSIACFLPGLLFAIAILKLTPLVTNFPKFLFTIFCLLVLYSNFYNIWYFYNYMDSFSSILQWSAFLLFIFFCLRLYLGETKSILGCAFSGLFAIGVYETAAIAVFWTSLGFWIADASRLPDNDPASPAWRRFWSRLKKSPFRPLQFWIWGGVLFSFLAPGNFVRSTIRHVPADEKYLKLAAMPHTWMQIVKKFFLDSWPLEIFSLSSLAAIFPSAKSSAKSPSRLLLIFLPPGLWLLFSLSASLLLALSDAALTPTSKFGDIFSCCLALALAFSLFPPLSRLVKRLRPSPGARAAIAIPLAAILLACVFMSRNFKMTAINAANGEMARYSQFYRNMEMELAQAAAAYAGNGSWPEFGFLGEIKNPEARSIRGIADKPHVILDEWREGGFPVWFSRVFQEKADAWPNERASWLYNVASLRSAFPNPANALAAAAKARAITPPPQLAKAGIKEIKLVKAAGFGSRPYLWVLLKSEKKLAGSLKIFVPAQLSMRRLLPFPVQKFLYQSFKATQNTRRNLKFELAGAILSGKAAASRDGWHLFPVPGYYKLPDFIYISSGGCIFEKASLRQ